METKNETFTSIKLRKFIYEQFDDPKFSLCPKDKGKSNKLILVTGHPGGGMASYYAYRQRHGYIAPTATYNK